MLNNFEVALAKEACLACGKLIDGPIIMNTKLTKKESNKIKEIHNKCIGYAEDLCNDCKELCNKGLLIIEIDADKSEPNNPYRTGKIFVIDNESDFVKNLNPKFIINRNGNKFIFIDKRASIEIGLYK